MLSPSILHFFYADFPSLLLIWWLLVSLLSLHFLPQAVELEVEQYFSLILHSTMLTIFSLESLLQESVLYAAELSASLPTSPCSTSWLGYACHSLLNHLHLPSILWHMSKLSEHSSTKPVSRYCKNTYCFQEYSAILLPTWSSVIT